MNSTKKRMCIVLIDFERTFDRVHKNMLWNVLEEQGYSQQLIRIIQHLYRGSKIPNKNNCRLSQQISVNRGVRQGSST